MQAPSLVNPGAEARLGCVLWRTWDTICQALAVSAELFFTTDWLLDSVFLTVSRTYLLFWSDLSLQGLALYHLCRSQAALPQFCSLFGGIFMATVCPQTGHGSDVLSNLVVHPSPVIGEQICYSQAGCAFTDVSIHNSSGTILALVTNLYSSEYFLLCIYLKICLREQLSTVVSAYGVVSGQQDCCKDTIPNIGITHKQPCEIQQNLSSILALARSTSCFGWVLLQLHETMYSIQKAVDSGLACNLFLPNTFLPENGAER